MGQNCGQRTLQSDSALKAQRKFFAENASFVGKGHAALLKVFPEKFVGNRPPIRKGTIAFPFLEGVFFSNLVKGEDRRFYGSDNAECFFSPELRITL